MDTPHGMGVVLVHMDSDGPVFSDGLKYVALPFSFRIILWRFFQSGLSLVDRGDRR